VWVDTEKTVLKLLFTSCFRHAHGYIWLGLTDPDRNRKWVWNDGTAATWLDWAPGEPNNAHPNRDDIAGMRIDSGQMMDESAEIWSRGPGRVVCQGNDPGGHGVSYVKVMARGSRACRVSM
jgi:hypothetical protein